MMSLTLNIYLILFLKVSFTLIMIYLSSFIFNINWYSHRRIWWFLLNLINSIKIIKYIFSRLKIKKITLTNILILNRFE